MLAKVTEYLVGFTVASRGVCCNFASKVLPRKVGIADLEVVPAISKNGVLMSKSRGGLKKLILNIQGGPATSYK